MSASSLTNLLARWEEAYRRGVELSPEELCPDAPALVGPLRQAIEWFRRVDAIADGGLTTLSRAPEAEGSLFTTIAPPPPPDGATALPAVPGYEIQGEVGRGGMGVIYKALHLSLGRAVALKMILSGAHAGAGELARFRREAEALARLRHPNIVTIHDIGEHLGHPFISLELCPGGSLERKLAGSPLPPRDAAALVETLARAMHAAHQANVVHRDLKPSNVLLAEGGTPKITDFGLAKKLDEVGQTQTGDVMGTPSYMAPEQARGQKDVGPPADIYALGAILYECLGGRPPFKAATTYDTLLQVIADEPVPPTQLNAKVPRDLDTIALKCLRKAPSERYPSALDLADDLARWRAGEAIRARPVGAAERARKWVRRRPAVSALLGLVAALVVGGVTAITLLYGDAVRERDAAREAERRAEKARAEADAERARAEERTAASRYSFQLAEVRRELELDNVERAAELHGQCPPDRRGWEHANLWLRLAEVARQREKKPVRPRLESIAFSPDGRLLAGGSAGNTVHVWDVSTGKQRQVLRMGKPFVWSARFSPQGRWLAAAAGPADVSRIGRGEGEVVLWDLETGARHRELAGHRGAALSVRFAPDGSWLATAGADRRVCLWEVPSGKLLRTLEAPDLVACLDVHPDGNLLAYGAAGSVVVCEVTTGRVVQRLAGHGRIINSLAFSGDGRLIASADFAGGQVHVWELKTGKKLRTFSGESAACVAFAPGRPALLCYAVTGSPAGWRERVTYHAFDLDGGKELWSLPSMAGAGEGVAFAPDGARVGLVLEGKVLIQTARGEGGPSVELTPTGLTAIPAGLLTRLEAASAPSVVLSSKEAKVSERPLAGNRVRVEVADKETGLTLAAMTCPALGAVDDLAAPDGSVRAADRPEGVALRDGRTGDLIALVGGAGAAGRGLAFSPDGRRLACANSQGVSLYDTRTGVELQAWPLREVAIRWLGFDDETGSLVAVGEGSSAEIWPLRPASRAPTRWALAQLWQAGKDRRWADCELLYDQLPPTTASNRGLQVQRASALLRQKKWPQAVASLEALTQAPPPRTEPLKWWLTDQLAARFADDADNVEAGSGALASAAPNMIGDEEEEVGIARRDDSALDTSLPARVRLSVRLHKPLAAALKANPNSWALHALRGWLLAGTGQDALAAKELTVAALLAGGRADVWALALDVDLRRGDAPGVEAAHGELTRLAPSALPVWYDQQAKGTPPAVAVWHLDKLLARTAGKDERELRARRGHALSSLKRWGEARADLERAAKLSPGDPVLRCDLAQAHLGAGDMAAYRRACAELIRRWPADRATGQRIAQACVLAPGAVADPNRVVRLAQWATYDDVVLPTASDIVVEPDRGRRSLLLGAALLRAGRTAEAARYLSGPGWNNQQQAKALRVLALRRLGREADAVRAEALSPGGALPTGASLVGHGAGPLSLISALGASESQRQATRVAWDDWTGLDWTKMEGELSMVISTR